MLGVAMLAGAADSRAAYPCTPQAQVGNGHFEYQLCDLPDFDQKRKEARQKTTRSQTASACARPSARYPA